MRNIGLIHCNELESIIEFIIVCNESNDQNQCITIAILALLRFRTSVIITNTLGLELILARDMSHIYGFCFILTTRSFLTCGLYIEFDESDLN